MPLGLDAMVPQFVSQFPVPIPWVSTAGGSCCSAQKPAASGQVTDSLRTVTADANVSRADAG
jgi:hypothetical protein